MSRSLAFASAMSVLLMATYTLFGEATARVSLDGALNVDVPAEASLPQLPGLPGLPSLR